MINAVQILPKSVTSFLHWNAGATNGVGSVDSTNLVATVLDATNPFVVPTNLNTANTGSGIWYAEFHPTLIFDYETSVDLVRVGITFAGHDPSKLIGDDNNEYGLLYNQDITGGTPASVRKGGVDQGFTNRSGHFYAPNPNSADRVGIQYNYNTGLLRFIDKHGATLCEGTIATGLTATITGTTKEGSMYIYGDPATWTIPVGTSTEGRDPLAQPFKSQFSTPGNIFFADGSLLTGPTDTPPNTPFIDKLGQQSQVVKRSQLLFWTWSTGPVQSATSGTINVDNSDGTYDIFVTQDSRDAQILISCGAQAPNSVAVPAFGQVRMQIDTTQIKDDRTLQLNCVDADATFANQVTTTATTTFYNEQPVDVTYPLTFGYCRSLPMIPLNPGNLLYVIADDGTFMATAIYDKAFPLNPLATPPDWTQDKNGNITLARTFVGVGTCDLLDTDVGLPQYGGLMTATNTKDSSHQVQTAFDGNRAIPVAGTDAGYWHAGPVALPQTITRTFVQKLHVNQVNLVSLQDNYLAATQPTTGQTGTLYVSTGFTLQYLDVDDVTWLTAATVTGNNKIVWSSAALTLFTKGIQVVITASQSSRAIVAELEIISSPMGTDLVSALHYIENKYGFNGIPVDYVTIEDRASFMPPRKIGFHSNARVRQSDLLSALAKTYNGCFYINRAGQLSFCPQTDPGTFTSEQPSTRSISNQDMKTDILVWNDTAPNLTSRAYGQANYQTLTDFSTDASVTATIKAALQQGYRIQKSSNATLTPMYNFAKDATPQGTLIDDEPGIQYFIDEINWTYSVVRNLAKFVLVRSANQNYALDLGTGIYLSYYTPAGNSRYGLDATPALIVGYEDDPLNDEITITAWF